ncbi:hypothetical protein ymoll0001_24440 [Yersinia mollaretii ATCC 43969]|uniref:Uncharacterized protein n=1 Tax=Yersinia mollaretii (strain ATCC 43969 / DSM 18520 / CIP 103324 / CNY 7263 / WAIP 204) TaxID=349967 RepID=A0ABM9Y4P0_YERMW|nr:hypothetical protein ymoll0001_24440 [Yersinia mollaretii ATCC 43969]
MDEEMFHIVSCLRKIRSVQWHPEINFSIGGHGGIFIL